MSIFSLFLSTGLFLLQASAECLNKGQRKAWHTLSNPEKLAYIRAEQCLMRLPPKLMYAHEYFLRTECGYEGFQSYWDETLDAGNFSSSVLLDPVFGFDGDGKESDGCITDGPFTNYTNAIGPGYLNTDHSIDRNISGEASLSSSQAAVDSCYENDSFETAWDCIQDIPHDGGHGEVGLQVCQATMAQFPLEGVRGKRHTFGCSQLQSSVSPQNEARYHGQ
ncbi:hypothetical protein EDB81DRAFT_759395 [Dactylonectria macrodidyma]|uniref:Tyrosinase copper-binding domain-containing protein n=1 Tax=Dactylonectria macrodidyma TaxID=307937 RepID=A0A9P9EX00_9HYPO|nr:hypothetical protein EDB81DRAFT_759395 [Dactylonectria macrodidyma]